MYDCSYSVNVIKQWLVVPLHYFQYSALGEKEAVAEFLDYFSWKNTDKTESVVVLLPRICAITLKKYLRMVYAVNT